MKTTVEEISSVKKKILVEIDSKTVHLKNMEKAQR